MHSSLFFQIIKKTNHISLRTHFLTHTHTHARARAHFSWQGGPATLAQHCTERIHRSVHGVPCASRSIPRAATHLPNSLKVLLHREPPVACWRARFLLTWSLPARAAFLAAVAAATSGVGLRESCAATSFACLHSFPGAWRVAIGVAMRIQPMTVPEQHKQYSLH